MGHNETDTAYTYNEIKMIKEHLGINQNQTLEGEIRHLRNVMISCAHYLNQLEGEMIKNDIDMKIGNIESPRSRAEILMRIAGKGEEMQQLNEETSKKD